MAKEVVPGLDGCWLPVALLDGEVEHEGAFSVGVYVKHERTIDALDRLGIPTTGGENTLQKAVDTATAAGETRRYDRLPDCEDQPEAIGVAWMGVKSAWPFSGVAVPQRNYAAWETYQSECSEAICEAADLALEALEANYDPKGNVKA